MDEYDVEEISDLENEVYDKKPKKGKKI